MGINIAGIAIDNNFGNDVNQLGEAFEWAIDKIENNEFGNALSIFSSNEKDVFYIFFTAKGTLVLTPFEWAIEEYHPVDTKSLCFAFSETSMNFLFSYQHENSKYRKFIEDEGQKKSEMGEPLKIENQYPNASGLIFKIIEDLIGENFHSIEHNEVVYKCRRLSHKEYTRRSEERLTREMELEKRNDDERMKKYINEIGSDSKEVKTQLMKKKKWWEIWK